MNLRNCIGIRPRSFSFALALLAVFGGTFRAVEVRAYMTIQALGNNQSSVSPTYDRFDNDPSFIGNSFNMSGVGQGFQPAENGQSGDWATMISPSYFISAWHEHPGGQFNNNVTWDPNNASSQIMVRFYSSNNQAGSFEDYSNNPADSGPSASDPNLRGNFSVVGEIGNGDLWLGKLNTPVTSDIAKYPILATPAAASSSNFYASSPIMYTVGVGTGGSTNPNGVFGTNQRLGRNQIDHATTTTLTQSAFQSVFPGTTDIGGTDIGQNLRWLFAGNGLPRFSHNDLGNDESLVNGGDSGAPDFITVSANNTMPAVVGVNWFQLQDNSGVGIGSGSTFVPGYTATGQPTGFSLATLESAMYGSGEQPSLVFADPTQSRGDFNMDGKLETADIQAMLTALSNPTAFEALHGVSASYFATMADVNNDGVVNDADIQALISLLANSGLLGKLSVVPEPGTTALLLAGVCPFLWLVRRKARLPGH